MFPGKPAAPAARAPLPGPKFFAPAVEALQQRAARVPAQEPEAAAAPPPVEAEEAVPSTDHSAGAAQLSCLSCHEDLCIRMGAVY